MSSKGPPSFFSILQKNGCSKTSKGPLFNIFRHYATYRRPKKIKKVRIFFQFFPHAGTVEENTWHFEVLLLFLSLRYGADLGRSRLVWSCFSVLWNREFIQKRILDAQVLLFLLSLYRGALSCRSWLVSFNVRVFDLSKRLMNTGTIKLMPLLSLKKREDFQKCSMWPWKF